MGQWSGRNRACRHSHKGAHISGSEVWEEEEKEEAEGVDGEEEEKKVEKKEEDKK